LPLSRLVTDVVVAVRAMPLSSDATLSESNVISAFDIDNVNTSHERLNLSL
jgi:hypothetical protein